MRLKSAALCCLLLAASARAADADGYERVSLIKHADFEISVLYRATATPADREFIGFAIDNKTAGPLELPLFYYEIADLKRTNRATSRPVLFDPPEEGARLWGGSSSDLFRPEGADRNSPPPPLPPGESKGFDRISEVAFQNFGIPPKGFPGLAIEARVRFDGSYQKQRVSTPAGGVPIRFDWLPSSTGEPEGFSADDLIFSLRSLNPVRTILTALDSYHPNDPKFVALALKSLAQGGQPGIGALSQSTSLHDARLIEPLRALAVSDVDGRGPEGALQLLSRQLDLAPDRASLVADLGRAFLARSPHVRSGSFAGDDVGSWEREMRQLALTRDPALVTVLLPYLDKKDVVINAKEISLAGDGVSLRACDIAYSTILDFLEREGERFKMNFGWEAIRRRVDPKVEYARRDALIAKLKAELTAKR